MHGFFECPKCGYENSVQVESYKFADIPPECDQCGYIFKKREIEDRYLDVLSDAVASAADYAERD